MRVEETGKGSWRVTGGEWGGAAGNKGNLARWECKGLGKRGVCRNKARESEQGLPSILELKLVSFASNYGHPSSASCAPLSPHVPMHRIRHSLFSLLQITPQLVLLC